MQVFLGDWGSHSTKLSCFGLGEIIPYLMDFVDDPSSHAATRLGSGFANWLNHFMLAKTPWHQISSRLAVNLSSAGFFVS